MLLKSKPQTSSQVPTANPQTPSSAQARSVRVQGKFPGSTTVIEMPTVPTHKVSKQMPTSTFSNRPSRLAQDPAKEKSKNLASLENLKFPSTSMSSEEVNTISSYPPVPEIINKSESLKISGDIEPSAPPDLSEKEEQRGPLERLLDTQGLDADQVTDIVNNSLFRDVRAISVQDEFEEALEKIEQNRLLSFDLTEELEPKLIKEVLDGRVMLEQVAKGKIEFPLTSRSLRKHVNLDGKILNNISVALQDNIITLDKKIIDLKIADLRTAGLGSLQLDSEGSFAHLGNKTEYFENYKKALQSGCLLLKNVPENAELIFCFKLVITLDEIFTLLEKSEEERANGHYDRAYYLQNEASAALSSTEESAQLQPRADIIEGFNQAFNLFQKAKIHVNEGYQTYYIRNQGRARLDATLELARPKPREDIIKGFNEAFEFFQKAEREDDEDRAKNLYYQGRAHLCLTLELARPKPREDIIKGFNKVLDLFTRANCSSSDPDTSFYIDARNHLYATEQLAGYLEIKDKSKLPRRNACSIS